MLSGFHTLFDAHVVPRDACITGVIGGRVAAVLADAVVIGVTWKRTWTALTEAAQINFKPKLTTVLMRDGTLSITLIPTRIRVLSMLNQERCTLCRSKICSHKKFTFNTTPHNSVQLVINAIGVALGRRIGVCPHFALTSTCANTPPSSSSPCLPG